MKKIPGLNKKIGRGEKSEREGGGGWWG